MFNSAVKRKQIRILRNVFLCAILGVAIPGVLFASGRTVKVGIYQNKPKVFIDAAGKPRGFFIDILNYIASKERWQLDYVPSTWESNLEKLATAEIDLLLDIAESEGRALLFDFSKESVFSNWAIVYVQKNSQIQSISDLRGKKIAAMKGDISFERFRRNIENLGIYSTFEPVDNFSDVFEQIAQEKVDAGIISRLYGLQHDNNYNVTRSTIICCPENLYFAVPKKKNQDLIQKIDRHLNQLKRDDQSLYYTSLIKWIEGFAPWKFPVWLVWLLVLVGGLLMAFAAGLVILKRQVNFKTVELRKRNEELLTEIAERQRAETEKEALQAQLIQAQKMEAVGTLAGGIAHDFNNFLQAILGYTENLLFGKTKSDPGYHELNGIRSGAIQAGKLTRQLLTFSSKVDSKLDPVDLNLEVQKVKILLERTLPKMIKIELDLAKELKMIHADSGQIEQILLNLALNASHAMSDDGKIILATNNFAPENDDIRKSHWGTDRREYVLLTVADTGHGIEKEIQNRIFEPFFTTKAPGQGTGLGLSMVYGIVKNHHGYIECSSEPGVGTRFNIYFPVIKSEKLPQDDISTQTEKIPTGNETILLVEDDESNLDAVKRMLQHFGYQVTAVNNAEKALEFYLVEKEKIDLVILDLNMPGMGGRKGLDRMLAIKPNLKTIVTSGYSAADIVDDIHKKGKTIFVEKPYQIKNLLKIIRQMLDNHL